MNQLLGSRIKMIRISKDKTQEQVASMLGISRQKYARIENGANNITLETISNIARVFGVSVNDITRVLDEANNTSYRRGIGEDTSANKVFEMLDLFYANKHAYMRLIPAVEEME